jgi:hypothetical protein
MWKARLSFTVLVPILCGAQERGIHERTTMTEAKTWNVTLAVAPSPRGLIATVTFKNQSEHPAPLYKWNACFGGRIHNDVFEISIDSHVVPYIGRFVKRGEPKEEDFLTLPRGAHVSFDVELLSAYDFPAGAHRYTIRYSALNPYLGRAGFDELNSNSVVFEYSREQQANRSQ